MRDALSIDDFKNQVQSESLPELRIHFMSEQDEQNIRDCRESEDFFKAPGIDIDVIEESA